MPANIGEDGSTLVTAGQDGVRLVDLATGAATVLTAEETRAVTLILHEDQQRGRGERGGPGARGGAP